MYGGIYKIKQEILLPKNCYDIFFGTLAHDTLGTHVKHRNSRETMATTIDCTNTHSHPFPTVYQCVPNIHTIFTNAKEFSQKISVGR